MELLQPTGLVCKYANLGHIRRTFAPRGNISTQARMADRKTGAGPNEPRRDEKWEAFRLLHTSAPHGPSQTHPKVCIYPLLASSRLLPLTFAHPRKAMCLWFHLPNFSQALLSFCRRLHPYPRLNPLKVKRTVCMRMTNFVHVTACSLCQGPF